MTAPTEVPDKVGAKHGALPVHGNALAPKTDAEKEAEREARRAKRAARRAAAVASIAPRVLDLDAAAVYLGVSPWVIRDLEHAGRLRRVRLDLGKRSVRKLLYDVQDLNSLVEAMKA